jgi:CheY-like chemotaxis protein
MQQKKYPPQQLSIFLESELDRHFTGTLSLETQVSSWERQKSCVLAIEKGMIVYGGVTMPSPTEFAQILGAKLNPSLINAALSMAKRKVNNPNSFRELIEILIEFQVFTWKQVETIVELQIIANLEQLTPHPGQSQWKLSNNIDLTYGQDGHFLDWSKIKQELNRRQQEWQKLLPQIPAMDAIPQVDSQSLNEITEPSVEKHLQQYVNGNNTLLDIAQKLNKEPLTIAQSYYKWVERGWVSFGNNNRDRESEIPVSTTTANNNNRGRESEIPVFTTTANNFSAKTQLSNLPIVLSLDDSPIVQLSIKRILQQHYQVILASKPTEALEILNRKPISLLLLDLTMPEIDGLEFCKTIRQMPQFGNLPIVMVTARDGLIDKMKGQIAGTNKYLTKPFQPEELLTVVGNYIKTYQISPKI